MEVAQPGESGSQRDIKWAEGLRGVASILVVTSHLARALSPLLLSPGLEDSHPTLLQLPFLRLPFQGPPWVALFFLLTGYVNAMRPIKQARAGDAAGALGSISSSALRRTSRLVLPTTVATIVSATICFLGGYRLAKSCDSDWIRDSSPDRAANVPDALRLLVWNIFTTWSMGANIYDPVQWTLFLLLQASMSVYLLLLATVRVTPRYRMLAAVALYAFSWAGRDFAAGVNTYAGVFLAEVTLTPIVARARASSRLLLTFFAMTVGLFLAGYPESNPQRAGWSRKLERLGQTIFPSGTEVWRAAPALGSQLVLVAVLSSTTIQRVLSRPRILWLGSISLPIYLLHGPLLRTVFTWLMFGFEQPIKYSRTDDSGKMIEWSSVPFPLSLWRYVLAIAGFGAVLLAASQLWNVHVDPWCARATKRLEELALRPALVALEAPVEVPVCVCRSSMPL